MELPQLQSLIGKDAAAYRDDFLLQYRHFQTERAIFVLNPSQQSKRFTNLVNFLTAVAQHYVGDVTDLPREIITYVAELRLWCSGRRCVLGQAPCEVLVQPQRVLRPSVRPAQL